MASDDQLNANLERIIIGLRSQLDGSLRRGVEEIVRALAADRDRAVAGATADVRRQAQEQLAQLREAAKKQTDDVRASAEAQIAELRGTLEELKRTAQQQVEAVRSGLEGELAAVRAKAGAELEEAHRRFESEVAAVRARAGVEVEEAHRSREREVAAVRAQAGAEIEEAHRSAQARLDELHNAANAHVTRLEHQLERAKTDLERERQRTEAARQAAAAQEHSVAEVVDAARSLDDSRSLRDVFERLLEYAGRKAQRAALLLVDADRIRGWRGAGVDVGNVISDVAEAGLVGAAVREARAVSRRAGEGPELPSFAAGAERDAVAHPLTVSGVVVAVLYADVAPAADAAWLASLEVVSRHASRVLETTTIQQAIGVATSSALARPSQPAPAHPRPGSVQ